MPHLSHHEEGEEAKVEETYI
uniref:Uncharacterized protein n=1 Tax=Tetranychus urticae TaxID=32264 RepID=T1JQB2_TETUR